MSSTERIYTFECNLTVAGKNLSVAAINIDMTVGSIPTIEFNVDPFHEKGKSPKNAFTPSLKHYFTGPIPEALYEAVNKSEPNATFSLTVKSASDNQTIQCNGWVPVGAGYNEASSVNMAGFSITISHPLILANQSSRILPSFSQFTPSKDSITRGNPKPFYDFITEIIDKRIKNIPDDPKTRPAGSNSLTSLSQFALKALSALKKNLTWESGTKDKYSTDSMHKAACMTMVNQIFSPNTYSPLQAIITLLCPNYFIRLTTDPKDLSKPMVLGPLEPWGDVSITIDDKEISKLQPAPVSYDRITGVAVSQSSFAEFEPARREFMMNQFAVNEPEDAATADAKYPPGPLKTVDMPRWLTDYINTVTTPPRPKGGANVGTRAAKQSEKPVDPRYMPFYVNNMRKWLKAELQYLHYADKTIMVFTKLLLTKDGNLVRPGVVYEINGGMPLCYFYATKIRHRINVAAAEAYTIIEGGYFRSTKGGSFDVTPAFGAKNPLFG